MKNRKSIKTYLFIIIALAAGLIFGLFFGKPNNEYNFGLLNRNLEKSINQIEIRNERLYDDLAFLYELNPEKVGQWFVQAEKARHSTETVYNFIQEIKEKEDKQSKTTRITHKEIAALQNLLDAHTDFLLATKVIPYNNEFWRKTFSYDNIRLLSRMPPAAFVAALSKIQVDVRNNETEVLRYLINMIDASDVRVNRLEALVIPNSKYIRLGDTYSAYIALAAVDTTMLPIIRVNGELITGGLYEVKPTSTGTFTYSGAVELQVPGGMVYFFPFKSEYIVR